MRLEIVSDRMMTCAATEEERIAACRGCSECEGADHHWLEEYDVEADDMFLECKHCPAHRPVPDDWGDEEDD